MWRSTGDLISHRLYLPIIDKENEGQLLQQTMGAVLAQTCGDHQAVGGEEDESEDSETFDAEDEDGPVAPHRLNTMGGEDNERRGRQSPEWGNTQWQEMRSWDKMRQEERLEMSK